jgi:hypothetical protein
MEDNALGEKAPMKADDLNGSDQKAPVSRIASRQHRQILEISLSRSERISFARDKAPEYWADLFRQADPDGVYSPFAVDAQTCRRNQLPMLPSLCSRCRSAILLRGLVRL